MGNSASSCEVARTPSNLTVQLLTDGSYFVDSTASVLASGPPAMDLAFTQAVDRGVGIVYLSGGGGSSLLGELAYRAAAASEMVCAVSWVTVADEKSPGHGYTLITGPGTDGCVGTECSSSSISDLLEALGKANGPLGHKEVRDLATGVLTQCERRVDEKAHEAVLVCARLTPGARSWFEPVVRAAVEKSACGVRIQTRAARDRVWRNACASGLEVNRKTWCELYERSRGILVSDAEESYS